MRIVVTGADGVVGRGVAARLRQPRPRRRRRRRQRPESWPGSVEFVDRTGSGADVLAGADVVVHCASTMRCWRRSPRRSRRLVAASSAWTPTPRRTVDGVDVRSGLVLGRDADEPVLRAFARAGALRRPAASADRPLQVVHPHDRRARRVARRSRAAHWVVDVAADGAHHRPRHRRGRRPPAGPRAARPLRAVRRPGRPSTPSRLRDDWGSSAGLDARRSASRTSRWRCRGRVAVGPPSRPCRGGCRASARSPPSTPRRPTASTPSGRNRRRQRRIRHPDRPPLPGVRRDQPVRGAARPVLAVVGVGDGAGTRAAALVISAAAAARRRGAARDVRRTTGVFGHRLYAGITSGHFMAQTVPLIDPRSDHHRVLRPHRRGAAAVRRASCRPSSRRGVVRQLRGVVDVRQQPDRPVGGSGQRHPRLRRRRRRAGGAGRRPRGPGRPAAARADPARPRSRGARLGAGVGVDPGVRRRTA